MHVIETPTIIRCECVVAPSAREGAASRHAMLPIVIGASKDIHGTLVDHTGVKTARGKGNVNKHRRKND